MKELVYTKTRNSPGINFNPNTGMFYIEGKSILEDPATFYEGIFNWVHNYFLNPQPLTVLDIKIEYINSSSSKYLTALLRIFEKYHLEGKKCRIIWRYEKDDDSIAEFGIHFQAIIAVDFELVEYEDDEN